MEAGESKSVSRTVLDPDAAANLARALVDGTRSEAPKAVVVALAAKAKDELGRIIENIPHLVDAFARDTAFNEAETLLKNLKSLVVALNDSRFSDAPGGINAPAETSDTQGRQEQPQPESDRQVWGGRYA